jgi:hypothetical protein
MEYDDHRRAHHEVVRAETNTVDMDDIASRRRSSSSSSADPKSTIRKSSRSHKKISAEKGKKKSAGPRLM